MVPEFTTGIYLLAINCNEWFIVRCYTFSWESPHYIIRPLHKSISWYSGKKNIESISNKIYNFICACNSLAYEKSFNCSSLSNLLTASSLSIFIINLVSRLRALGVKNCLDAYNDKTMRPSPSLFSNEYNLYGKRRKFNK